MADQRILYTEEMVGAGHPVKTDTLNRLTSVEHNVDGTHYKLTNVTDPWVDVRAYGAVGDGVTDDSTAIQNALNALSWQGGQAWLARTGRYYIGSDITVPNNCAIVGHLFTPEEQSDFSYTGSALIINSSATIKMSKNSALRGMYIFRQGLTYPQSESDLSSWQGTAITLNDGTNYGVGVYLGHLSIFGFFKAIDGGPGITQAGRFRAEYLNIDCINGIHLGQAFDVCYIKGVHCWPFMTTGGTGTYKNHRDGSAFKLENRADWAKLTDCFSYGYRYGFNLEGVRSVMLISCGADYPAAAHPSYDSVGFRVSDDASLNPSGEVTLIGCQAAGQGYGMSLKPKYTLGRNTIQVLGCTLWENDKHHIYIAEGVVSIIGSKFNGGGASGTSNAVTIDSIAYAEAIITGNTFAAIGNYCIYNIAGTNRLYEANNRFVSYGAAKPVYNTYIPTAASAATLQLADDCEIHKVSGTTAISDIDKKWAGRRATLIFQGSLTVTDGTGLRLSGDFTTSTEDVLTLVCDGSYWYEVARSGN